MRYRNCFLFVGVFLLVSLSFVSAAISGMVIEKDDPVYETSLQNVQLARENFYEIEAGDIEMIKGLLEGFMLGEDYKETFVARDRAGLYDMSLALFEKNRDELGITHFYYETMDGEVFLRVHNKDNYGDMLNRITYEKARDSGSWGSGIELGKTAFALRVVSPYYLDEEQIGYVEFGQEIEHFLGVLKERGGGMDDYGVVVRKEFIDEGDWGSVRDVKGLRNNYDDLEGHVMIDTTREDSFVFSESCFVLEDVDDVSDEGNLFDTCELGDKSYLVGGFALYDAGGSNVGAVLVAQDVTEFVVGAGGVSVWFFVGAGALIVMVLILLYARGKDDDAKVRTYTLRKKMIFTFLIIVGVIAVAGTIAVFNIKSLAEPGVALSPGGDSIRDQIASSSWFVMMLVVLVMVIVMGVGIYMSNSITRPVAKLRDATEELEKGNFNVRVDIKSGDDFEKLAETFNRTAETLGKTDEERNQIDKAKTEFLSITSHELRSPMTPMRAQLQMVMGNYFGELNEKQKDSLGIVLRNTERLDRIIRDFLEISRIEAARLKFSFKKVDPAKVAQRIVDEMKGFMPEKKITIEARCEKLPIIEADPDRMGQVLRNLINNAIKFTSDKGKIVVEGKMREGMVLFSVRDNGVGIKPEDQIRIFEPFYQVENMYQHKSGGTGLGLAIVRGIVESQNGKIWLESKVGNGTVFYFTVPLKPVKEIKSIKLLFSPKSEIDGKIRDLFKEILGPMGEKEFEALRNQKRVTQEEIVNYIDMLAKKKIIDVEKSDEFKSKTLLLYGSKPEEASSEEFVKPDLVEVDELKKKGVVKK